MGRSSLAVIGLVGLLTVGCSAGPIEMAVAPIESEASVDDLAFDTDDATEPPAGVLRDPFSAVVVVDVESGYVFDGTYVPEFTAPSMRWTVLADIDQAVRYGFLAIGGVAEPGDRGCTEYVETFDGQFARSSFDGRIAAFETDTSGEISFDAVAASFPLLASDIAAAHGLEPWATSEAATGERTTTVALTAEAVAAVRALLIDPGGIDTIYDTGTLVTVEDRDGHLVSVSLDALAEVDGRRETLDLDLSYQAPQVQVTPDSPWAATAGCPSAAVDLTGGWKVLSVGPTAVADLPSLAAATLLFGSDGAFSGTTGCQTLTGRVDFGYSWIDGAEIALSGEPCAGIESILEAALLAAFTGGADLTFDGDGQVVLTTPDSTVVLTPL
jgi:heat shock protein HslJ